jgi:hypothetical protein
VFDNVVIGVFLASLNPLSGVWFCIPPGLLPPVGLRVTSECAQLRTVGVALWSQWSW